MSAPASLGALADALRAGDLPAAAPRAPFAAPTDRPDADFGDVVGQQAAKRALEVAAAGGHNVVLVGPPGAGKTMLARRLPTILPALTEDEALAVIAVQSVAGLLPPGRLAAPERPFRAPHHTVSTAGLIGGGSTPRPGEVSLAHHGVLFLDEMLEFPRHVLDALRQPMEDGRVTIARANSVASFPARFTLVGATNPCPCGGARRGAGVSAGCGCSATEVAHYRARLSGPLADRIDMHVGVGAVPIRSLGAGAASGDSSSAVRARVQAARERQRARYALLGERVACNAHAPARWLHGQLPAGDPARALLVDAAERLALSARAYHRILKVARTIADLDGDDRITTAAVAEALRYRPTEMPTGAMDAPPRARPPAPA